MFTGNRGILHDPQSKTLKHQRWATDGWVICTLHPLPNREPRPELMMPGRWTELFFLDEAVGLAAGHRPCYACRKDAARAFRNALGLERVSAVNTLINEEMKRYLRARAPEPRQPCDPGALPDGAFFAKDGKAFLKWAGAAHAFRFEGYGPAEELPTEGLRLTPQASCDALHAGYKPVMHHSLTQAAG